MFNNLMRWCYSYSHFTDEKTQHRDKAHECLSNLPKSYNYVAGVCVGGWESQAGWRAHTPNTAQIWIVWRYSFFLALGKKIRIRWLHWALSLGQTVVCLHFWERWWCFPEHSHSCAITCSQEMYHLASCFKHAVCYTCQKLSLLCG